MSLYDMWAMLDELAWWAYTSRAGREVAAESIGVKR